MALTCETPAAIIAPMWIIGPSLPRGRPEEHEKIMPIALQSNVLNRTNRGIFRPFRKHLISGMPFKKNVSFPHTSIMYRLGVIFKVFKPDPALRGSIYTANHATEAKTIFVTKRKTYAIPKAISSDFSFSNSKLNVLNLKLDNFFV